MLEHYGLPVQDVDVRARVLDSTALSRRVILGAEYLRELKGAIGSFREACKRICKYAISPEGMLSYSIGLTI